MSQFAIAYHADFDPKGAPAGMVEWTFLVPRTAAFGAGLYELRYLRVLKENERGGDLLKVIREAGS